MLSEWQTIGKSETWYRSRTMCFPPHVILVPSVSSFNSQSDFRTWVTWLSLTTQRDRVQLRGVKAGAVTWTGQFVMKRGSRFTTCGFDGSCARFLGQPSLKWHVHICHDNRGFGDNIGVIYQPDQHDTRYGNSVTSSDYSRNKLYGYTWKLTLARIFNYYSLHLGTAESNNQIFVRVAVLD